MKVYITKYALTRGIFEIDADVLINYPDTVHSNKYGFFDGENKEWCRTRETAVSRAEEMRLKKIESLKKQIEKLERMKFQ